MRTAVCYYSRHHGNTRKVLEAMAQEGEIDLIDATVRQTVRLERALRSCGLFGAGTYYKNLLIRFCGTVLLPDGLRQRAYQRYLRHDDMPETPWAGTLTDHNSEE